jgi:hypothetical protein
VNLQPIQWVGFWLVIESALLLLVLWLTRPRGDYIVKVEMLDDDGEPCCEPDYSYDLGLFVHSRNCRNADSDTDYLRRERDG